MCDDGSSPRQDLVRWGSCACWGTKELWWYREPCKVMLVKQWLQDLGGCRIWVATEGDLTGRMRVSRKETSLQTTSANKPFLNTMTINQVLWPSLDVACRT